MKKVILKIEGMSCSACQNRVEKYLNKQEGVEATVNLVMQQALIYYDEEKVSLADLDRFVSESGYKSLGIYDERVEEKKDHTKEYLIILAFVMIFLMYVSMSHMIGFPVIPFLHMMNHPTSYGIALFLLTIPFLVFGLDILKSGIVKLFHKSANMDTLVTIGVLASFIYSFVNLILIILGNKMLVENLYFESVAMILYFIKLGRFIDKNSKDKAKESIQELVQITPQSAFIKTESGEKEITIDEVKKGDILVCKPGMKFAVDGIITEGESYIDEAFITGESKPVKKKKEDTVIAGSMNIDGLIEYKAVNIGPDSTISEMVRLVVEAVNTKAPIGRIADKVSSIFVPSIMVIAILTFIVYLLLGKSLNNSLLSFVTVLVVACPCALGLATPLAIVVSMGSSIRKGILIKNGEVLENIQNIDTIVFDKTGTLTYGKLSISKINNYSKKSEEEILRVVASLEENSTHPIASAFKEYYDGSIFVSHFHNLSGIGISGEVNHKKYYVGNAKLFTKLKIQNSHEKEELKLAKEGNTCCYVIEDDKILALIGVKDIVRGDAKKNIQKLIHLKKEIIMLSGDHEEVANLVAKELGISRVIANVLPKEKENVLKEIMTEKHKVMMVGDGINDAPSLASSDIGVSLSSGTDIAGDSADILLIYDDLGSIVTLFDISKKTIRIIYENLFWAFIYNILMIPIAIGLLKPIGLAISPMLASIFMTVSSLTVVFNSLRLRK